MKLGDWGSFEASSFSWGTTNSPGAGGGGSGRQSLKDAVVVAKMSELGELVTKIEQAAARGDRIETVDVTIGGRVVHLKDVYIGSFDISKGDDPTVSFTLNFGSIEYGDGEKKGEVDAPARGA